MTSFPTSFPTSYGRAPNYLFTHASMAALNRTNVQLLRVNSQLISGRDILVPSDDPVRSAIIARLDADLERNGQILKNLNFAANSLDTLDGALGDAKSLIEEAMGIALEQSSTPTDGPTRAAQANVIDSLIHSLFNVANRESAVGYVFGGVRPGQAPVELLGNAYRFLGGRGGLTADLGGVSSVPITMGADNAIGALSARVDGAVDLNPALTRATRLADLNGARATGVNPGEIVMRFDAGPAMTVDLSGAVTAGNVADAITAAIRAYETEHGVSILGPGGVSYAGGAFAIDVPAGDLTFSDIDGASTALDLGLTDGAGSAFNAGNPAGADVDPRLTWTTPVSALQGLTGPLGQLSLTTGGQTRTIDLSTAQTLADVRSALESGGTGVVVELGADGRSIAVRTSVAGLRDQAMSIAEVAGGGDTATLLGIRTLSASTPLAHFNDGRGVQINPDDPDFTVTLGDGFVITIDLTSQHVGAVQDLLDAINAQAAEQLTAAGRPTTDFIAGLAHPGNGIAFEQDAALAATGAMAVTRLNNSPAAENLGLLNATHDAGGARMVSQDRAAVRVDNLFTHLLDLADALRRNDTLGIELAYSKLQSGADRLTQARGVNGGYARRVADETTRQEDRKVLNESMRSTLRDVDYAAASTLFAQLQLQLQAGLAVTAQSQQLTLLNYLG